MAIDDEAAQLASDPLYVALIKALHACSQDDASARVDDAVFALGSVIRSLASASGILWESTNLIEALRGLADELEERQKNEPAPPRRATLREAFVAARPAMWQ